MTRLSRISLLVAAPLLASACSKDWKDEGGSPVPDTGDSAVDTQDSDTGTPPAPTDADGDGHVTDAEGGDDCDDSDITVYAGAPELCDGKDNDCDGRADADVDGDSILDCNDYCPVYASPGAAGDGRFSSPLGTLQEAIDLAGATGCYEVRAYYGTYPENIHFNGLPVNVESLSGAASTIIDGGGVDSVVTFNAGEDAGARIYDFTITNGGGEEGAGLSVHDASPTIEGNVITDNATNVATYLGGGIRSYNGSPQIIDNLISNNDAGYGLDENGSDGGGIDVRGGAPYIEGNTIVGNTAGDGGGIWLAYSDAIVTHNWISNNLADDVDPEAGGQGGGVNVQIAGATQTWVVANVISDNVASMYGGGIVTYEYNSSAGEARIENNTIVYNEVTDTDLGAGFCQWGNTTPVVVNNIIAFNHGTGAYSEGGIDSTFTYNLVYGNDVDLDGLTGAQNLSFDPLFRAATDNADWTDDDFRLKSTSSARNAGDPAILDADGTASDLGAYGGVNSVW